MISSDAAVIWETLWCISVAAVILIISYIIIWEISVPIVREISHTIIILIISVIAVAISSCTRDISKARRTVYASEIVG